MKTSNFISSVTSNSKRFLDKNAPTILTWIAATGVIATSVSAVKATKKYDELLLEAECAKDDDLTKIEKVRLAIPTYAPTIFLGMTTIGCIFGSDSLHKRKQATLASAYMLLDSSYKEYRSKVKELYGDDADRNIISSIAKDRYKSDEMSINGDEQLFYEPVSRRYFEATMAQVKEAECELNRRLVTNRHVRLNEYFAMLDLDPTDTGDVLGWTNSYIPTQEWLLFDDPGTGCEWIDLEYVHTELEDGLECWVITYPVEPGMDYMDF